MRQWTRWRGLAAGAVCLWLPAWSAGAPAVTVDVPEPAGETLPTTDELILRGGWGPGLGEFGKRDEASRPGPMDFALVDGTLYVLDPVNARVQVFDLASGSVRAMEINTHTADFLHVARDGTVTVLDAFVRREFRVFAADGSLRRTARVPDTISLPSAVAADGDRVWIEERHDRVFELDASEARPGQAAPVVRNVPGRPIAGDRFVHARKLADGSVDLRIGAEGSGQNRRTLRFPGRIEAVTALETDGADRTYIAVRRAGRAAEGSARSDLLVTRLRPDGYPDGTRVLPDAYVTDHYRKIFVTPSGELIQMQTTEEDVRFVRWTFPESQGERSRP